MFYRLNGRTARQQQSPFMREYITEKPVVYIPTRDGLFVFALQSCDVMLWLQRRCVLIESCWGWWRFTWGSESDTMPLSAVIYLMIITMSPRPILEEGKQTSKQYSFFFLLFQNLKILGFLNFSHILKRLIPTTRGQTKKTELTDSSLLSALWKSHVTSQFLFHVHVLLRDYVKSCFWVCFR